MKTSFHTVLLIGQKTGVSTVLDPSSDHKYGYTSVAACHNRDELYKAIVVRASTSPIDTLDVFDHGANGVIAIGDDILVDFSDPERMPDVTLFEQIAGYLDPRAHIRLLGCNTAVGPAGRNLLLALSAALGAERLVFGTIERVLPEQFSEAGFLLSNELLYSSRAALDYPAPTAKMRQHSIVLLQTIIKKTG
jgi:Domain of unknown function (DUF4347)